MLEKTASSVHVINLDLVAFESNGDHVFERPRNTLHVLLITQWSAISTASTGLRMNSLEVLKYQFNYSMYNMISLPCVFPTVLHIETIYDNM